MNHVIRSIRADEWPAVKELRLTALRDPVAHLAFLETYEQSAARPDSFWQERAAGAAEGDGARQFVAVGPGRGVGGYRGHAGREGRAAGLLRCRDRPGTGASGRCLRAGRTPGERCDGRARRRRSGLGLEGGLERVRLFVHEKNGRAEAFYRRTGFVPTGGSVASQGNEVLGSAFAIARP